MHILITVVSIVFFVCCVYVFYSHDLISSVSRSSFNVSNSELKEENMAPSDFVLHVRALIRMVNAVSGRCSVIYTLKPSDAFFDSNVLNHDFAFVSRSFRRNFTTGNPIPKSLAYTFPFTVSSVRSYPFDTHRGYINFNKIF